MKQTFNLVHAQARQNAIEAVRTAQEGHSVVISEPKRTNDQSAKFHALVGDIAKAGTEWAGKRRNADDWKMLMVSAHAVATKEGGEVIPGLEGEFVAIRESTASMSKRRGASLIEYTLAFCAMHEVKIFYKEPQ